MGTNVLKAVKGVAKGGKKASLPDVMDVDELIHVREDVAMMLDHAITLKVRIGVQPDEKKHVAGSGLLKEMYDLKEALGAIVAEHGLDGLRFGHVVFTQRLQDGKAGLDTEKFCQELLARGVKAEVIVECAELAKKQGDSFWVRQVEALE